MSEIKKYKKNKVSSIRINDELKDLLHSYGYSIQQFVDESIEEWLEKRDESKYRDAYFHESIDSISSDLVEVETVLDDVLCDLYNLNEPKENKRKKV